MTGLRDRVWIEAAVETVASYRRILDAALVQLTDEELFAKPTPITNSIAIVLRHLGGNLKSRWTDFRITDGEKPDRQRDQEFEEWTGDRQSLMEHFETGWQALTAAIDSLEPSEADSTITIRGEPHTIALALMRSLTHLSYHVGQILMIARTVHQGEWKWLTVAPGASAEHNQTHWGTSASRGTMGMKSE